MYADDAGIILNLNKEEIHILAEVLHVFGEASVLSINKE
jgi:hypothetical protein